MKNLFKSAASTEKSSEKQKGTSAPGALLSGLKLLNITVEDKGGKQKPSDDSLSPAKSAKTPGPRSKTKANGIPGDYSETKPKGIRGNRSKKKSGKSESASPARISSARARKSSEKIPNTEFSSEYKWISSAEKPAGYSGADAFVSHDSVDSTESSRSLLVALEEYNEAEEGSTGRSSPGLEQSPAEGPQSPAEAGLASICTSEENAAGGREAVDVSSLGEVTSSCSSERTAAGGGRGVDASKPSGLSSESTSARTDARMAGSLEAPDVACELARGGGAGDAQGGATLAGEGVPGHEAVAVGQCLEFQSCATADTPERSSSGEALQQVGNAGAAVGAKGSSGCLAASAEGDSESAIVNAQGPGTSEPMAASGGKVKREAVTTRERPKDENPWAEEISCALELCAAGEQEEPVGEEMEPQGRGSMVEGLEFLRSLSKEGKSVRGAMVDAGVVEAMLRLQDSPSDEVLVLALTVLLNISFDEERVKDMGVMLAFVEKALASASQPVNEAGVAAVFSLSRSDCHRHSLLQRPTVRALVRVLDHGSDQAKRDSCKALFHLSYLPQSYPVLLEEGLVPPAVNLLYPPDTSIAEKATCLLSNVARCPEGCQAIAGCDDGLANLVEVLNEGLALSKEFSAATLLLIAQSDAAHRKCLIFQSPFIALNGLQNTGSARARLKASALLSLLREQECT